MIKDDDIIQLYGSILSVPHGLEDSKILGNALQIFRGVNNVFHKNCTRHLELFSRFQVIPKHCFDCYKVLITPGNIVDFFKLLMVFDKIELPEDKRRKCLVETRENSSGSYKGLIYCKGIAEAKEVSQYLRKVISDNISSDVGVTLQRGCSPYGHAYPGYAQIKPGSVIMQYRKSWQTHEDYFDKHYSIVSTTDENIPNAENDILYESTDGLTKYTRREIYCLNYYLRYAATIGDTRYLAIAGKTLPPIPGLTRPHASANSNKN